MSTTFTVRGATSGWVVDIGHGVISMETVLCTRCGLLYAMPEALIAAARKQGHGEITWRCPNNSCTAQNWGYHGKSEAEKAQEEAKWQRDRAARLSAELDQTKASLRAQKGATTKAKKRHAAALCPVLRPLVRAARPTHGRQASRLRPGEGLMEPPFSSKGSSP